MITNGQRVRRLERLYHLLITDANNPDGVRFNMNYWLGTHNPGNPFTPMFNKFTSEDHERFTMSCNTHACALGLACLDPELRAEGLDFRVSSADLQNSARMVPVFSGVTEFDAGQTFFGLTSDETLHLFSAYRYENTTGREAELEVARRVRRFIEKYSKQETSADDHER